MKFTQIFFLALTMIFSVALLPGCGDDDNAEPGGPEATGFEPTPGGGEPGGLGEEEVAERRIPPAQATAIMEGFFLGDAEGLIAAVETAYDVALELSDDDYGQMACLPVLDGEAMEGEAGPGSTGAACVDWPCTWTEDCWGDQLDNDSPKCDDYGEDRHMGTGLACFCKCADNGDWSSHVRSCLNCAHHAGVGMYEAHACCYARGSLDYDSPKFTLAKCWRQCH